MLKTAAAYLATTTVKPTRFCQFYIGFGFYICFVM